MQGKGIIRFFTIAFILVCLFQLSFSYFASSWDKKANQYALSVDSDENSAPYKRAKRNFIDSISDMEVLNLGFEKLTYKELKERQLNLGLDLQGGMSVVLQVSLEDLIRSMANNSKDPAFEKAISNAKEAQKNAQEDFVTLFGREYAKIQPDGSLAAIFSASPQYQNRITFNSTNTQVLDLIRSEAKEAVQRTYEIIKARIDKFGVAQPNVQLQENTGRIVVELPGVDDPERVRKLLQATANLQFWETYEVNQDMMTWLVNANTTLAKKLGVAEETPAATNDTTVENDSTKVAENTETVSENPDSTSLVLDEKSDSTETLSEAERRKQNPFFAIFQPTNQVGPVIGLVQVKDTAQLNKYLAAPDIASIFPKNIRFVYSAKPQEISNDDGGKTKYLSVYAIKSRFGDFQPRLDGGYVSDARRDFDMNQDVVVSMNMNSEGAAIWRKMTAENVNKSVAIVLDNQVYSAPVVRQEIAGGSSQISGNFTIEEADDLANILKVGKLPAPARIVEEAVVGPTLGKQSVKNGLYSLIGAMLLVLLFMVLYYNNGGWVANLALLLNMLFIIGVLAAIGATLTLPGMAGIVLTIGMAVDANVIIFERIREELSAGNPLGRSIRNGYNKSYSAIIDANVTTLITAFILAYFGLGPVLGFATILIIGIISSLFTAVLFSRMIMEGLINKNKNVKFSFPWSESKNYNFNILAYRKTAYTISLITIVIGLGFIIFRGFDLGVDFKGGRTYVIAFDKDVSTTDLADNLKTQFNGLTPLVRTYGSGSQVKITTAYKIDVDDPAVDAEIEQKVYDGVQHFYASPPSKDQFESDYFKSSQKVGPTIADDITKSAYWATIFALIAIFLYILIRFRRWQFGVAAVACTAHDTLIILSLFSIFAGILPFSMEVDQAFIAAILTIIGYSLNDTVIVFDRIREFLGLHPKRDRMHLMNDAVNTTLSRTVITSFTTWIVVLILFIFGGEVIRGFSFALLVGILVGTLSSIFVATPLVYDLLQYSDSKKTHKASVSASA